MSEAVGSEKVVFKKKSANANIRKRRDDGDLEDGEDSVTQEELERLEELREKQKFKRRTNKGVNVVDLLSKPKLDDKMKQVKEEKVGGLTDSKTIIKNELDLGNTFSVETNRRDEDAEMMKFIEEELAKRKGQASEEDGTEQLMVAKTSEDAVFSVLPQHLIMSNKKKNEEMLSNQMLSGIPEVDLGVDEKIRNIEATEDAKTSLLRRNSRRSKASAATLVPTNVAVNFVQHNRFNIREDEPKLATAPKKARIAAPVVTVREEPVVVVGDEPRAKEFTNYTRGGHNYVKHPGKERATDDYHFERFRKQFRK